MKNNLLQIEISCPVAEVYKFTLDPKNTPKWIDSIEYEIRNESPSTVGTTYENWSLDGTSARYVVSELKEDSSFTLEKEQSPYRVRYTFNPTKNGTLFEYFEWVETGELEDPFTIKYLKKLKSMPEA